MFEITEDQITKYRRDGFVILRDAIAPEIVEPLLDAVGAGAFAVIDSSGNQQTTSAWTWCGDDLLGRIPRSESLVNLAEAIIDAPVYHWHSKISYKEPGAAGRWDWHQDYAFWVEEGVSRPTMATIGIALDAHDSTNGCLRLVRGSHEHGVIDHPPVGHGRAADPTVVQRLIEDNGVVDVELAPGDAIVFSSLTLHGSDSNDSDRRRTYLHVSYNATDNSPTEPAIDGHQAHELNRVSDNAIRPGAWSQVMGDTAFLEVDNAGYSGRSGYQVVALDR